MFPGALKIKDVKIKVSELVRTLRAKHNLTQEQLAETLDLSRITIQNLEAGKNVTIDTLLKVLQHFELLERFDQMLQDEINNNQYNSLY